MHCSNTFYAKIAANFRRNSHSLKVVGIHPCCPSTSCASELQSLHCDPVLCFVFIRHEWTVTILCLCHWQCGCVMSLVHSSVSRCITDVCFSFWLLHRSET